MAPAIELLAAQALEIDGFNPHMAARLLGAFESWRILEPNAPGPRQGRSEQARLGQARPPTATRLSQKPSAPA